MRKMENRTMANHGGELTMETCITNLTEEHSTLLKEPLDNDMNVSLYLVSPPTRLVMPTFFAQGPQA